MPVSAIWRDSRSVWATPADAPVTFPLAVAPAIATARAVAAALRRIVAVRVVAPPGAVPRDTYTALSVVAPMASCRLASVPL